MKFEYKPIIVFSLAIFFCLMPTIQVKAQIIDAIKEAATKVIKALDLQIQRLQNKTIDLQNIQKQIENTLSKLKLQEIADWTQKQKDLYQQYFDELWKVKTVIAYYKRISEIIDKEKQLVGEYKKAYSTIQKDNHFTPDEVNYMYTVYSGIIDKSTESLDQILVLVESFTVQMSDAQRLELLNQSADEIESYITDLRRFTSRNSRLSLQRAKDLEEVNSIKQLYGIED